MLKKVYKHEHNPTVFQFRKNQELQTLKTSQSNKIAEIQGFQAASKNLGSKLNKIDQEALKQHEIIYNQVIYCSLITVLPSQKYFSWT